MYFATDMGFSWTEAGSLFSIVIPTPVSYVFSSAMLYPSPTATLNLGDGTNYWNDISYKTLTDRGGHTLRNAQEAWNLIKNLENETENGFCPHLEAKGHKRLKYSSFPVELYDSAKKIIEEDIINNDNLIIDENSFQKTTGSLPVFEKDKIIGRKGELSRLRIEKDKDGKNILKIAAEGLNVSGYIDYIATALKEAINRIENLEISVNALKK